MPRQIFQMKAMIVNTKPQVWRRLLVPKTASLIRNEGANMCSPRVRTAGTQVASP